MGSSILFTFNTVNALLHARVLQTRCGTFVDASLVISELFYECRSDVHWLHGSCELLRRDLYAYVSSRVDGPDCLPMLDPTAWCFGA